MTTIPMRLDARHAPSWRPLPMARPAGRPPRSRAAGWSLGALLLSIAAACGDAGERPVADRAAEEGPAGEAAGAMEARAPQDAYWERLQALCGQAYEGSVVEDVPATPGPSDFEGERLVMHVRECGEDEIRIPFHVGADRSRTWILTRTANGIRLKHDHRHEDGTDDEITMYGGDTRDAGTEARQDFHADAYTADLIPAAATNIWTMEVHPGDRFVYQLRREGTPRRFGAAFDLSQEVEAPPPPWGHDREQAADEA